MAADVIRLLESPEFAAEIARNAHEECQAYQWSAVRDAWVSAYTRLAGREATESVALPVTDSSSLQRVEEG